MANHSRKTMVHNNMEGRGGGQDRRVTVTMAEYADQWQCNMAPAKMVLHLGEDLALCGT